MSYYWTQVEQFLLRMLASIAMLYNLPHNCLDSNHLVIFKNLMGEKIGAAWLTAVPQGFSGYKSLQLCWQALEVACTLSYLYVVSWCWLLVGSFSSVLLRTAWVLHGVVLANPRADNSRKQGKTLLPYKVALETTLPFSHCILMVTKASIPLWERGYINTWRKASWGSCWRLSTTAAKHLTSSDLSILSFCINCA